jgi:hypothetical protein
MLLKPTTGCQISTLISENQFWREVSINIPCKYIKDGKVLANLELRLKEFPASLTDISA